MSEPPIVERAPAKTNLFLEVPRRRPDGFHELDTVFAELELSDELEVWPALEGELRLEVLGADPASVPSDASNLVLRAAAALRRAAGREELGARLRLTKRIPAGGGLGGGSSDAAAALRALDRVWGLDLAPEALHALAAELGSDVAFFLRGGLQRGRGRGELLEPLPAPAGPLELVLLLPGFPCPTPDVYRALAPFLPPRPRDPRTLLRALATGDPELVASHLFNRLEEPAFALFPALAALKAELEGRADVLGALLSGSGSTLLGLVPTHAAADRVVAELSGRGHVALATRVTVR